LSIGDVLLAAHAIAGVWVQLPSIPRVIYEDASVFRVQRPANIWVIETTGVTANNSKVYKTARRAATSLFTNPDWSLRFALGVKEAREAGIMPWGWKGV
jgi:hypothetical protein